MDFTTIVIPSISADWKDREEEIIAIFMREEICKISHIEFIEVCFPLENCELSSFYKARLYAYEWYDNKTAMIFKALVENNFKNSSEKIQARVYYDEIAAPHDYWLLTYAGDIEAETCAVFAPPKPNPIDNFKLINIADMISSETKPPSIYTSMMQFQFELIEIVAAQKTQIKKLERHQNQHQHQHQNQRLDKTNDSLPSDGLRRRSSFIQVTCV